MGERAISPEQPKPDDAQRHEARPETAPSGSGPVSGAQVHERIRHTDPVIVSADQAREVREPEHALEQLFQEYESQYTSFQILLAQYPEVRATVDFDDHSNIDVDIVALEIYNEVQKSVHQYRESGDNADSENYRVAIQNIKSAMAELRELSKIFLEEVAKRQSGHPDDQSGRNETINIGEVKESAALLRTQLERWQKIRDAIRNLVSHARFETLMRELPVPKLAKRHGLDTAKSLARRVENALTQDKVPDEVSRTSVQDLNRELALMIEAGEAMVTKVSLEASARPAGGPERTVEEESGMPTEKLARAEELLERWQALGKAVGMRRLLAALEEKYPKPEYKLPYVKDIAARVQSLKDPAVWTGQDVSQKREQLMYDLEQLEGIVGDAEVIVAEIRQKEGPLEKNEFEGLSTEEAVAKLKTLLEALESLESLYGYKKLRDAMMKDGQGSFPPARGIAQKLQHLPKPDEWTEQDRRLLLSDVALMTAFVARAEAAAKQLKPKQAVEPKAAPQPESKPLVTSRKPAGATIKVFPTGREVESIHQMTSWEKLEPEKAQEFLRLINGKEFNHFQRAVRSRLDKNGVTVSLDRNDAAQAALDVYMPKRIRQLAERENIEITDAEIETHLMSSLRKNLIVS